MFAVKIANNLLVRVIAKVDNLHTNKVGVSVPIRVGDAVVQHFVEVKGEKPRQTRTAIPKGCPVDCLVFLDQLVAGGEVLLVFAFESPLDAIAIVLRTFVGLSVDVEHNG